MMCYIIEKGNHEGGFTPLMIVTNLCMRSAVTMGNDSHTGIIAVSAMK